MTKDLDCPASITVDRMMKISEKAWDARNALSKVLDLFPRLPPTETLDFERAKDTILEVLDEASDLLEDLAKDEDFRRATDLGKDARRMHPADRRLPPEPSPYELYHARYARDWHPKDDPEFTRDSERLLAAAYHLLVVAYGDYTIPGLYPYDLWPKNWNAEYAERAGSHRNRLETAIALIEQDLTERCE